MSQDSLNPRGHPDGFRLTFRRLDSEILIAVGGELDLATAPRLTELFTVVFATEGACVVLLVDLEDVTFMDCSGFAPIAEAARQVVMAGGDLKIVRGSRQTIRLVEMLEFGALVSESV